jgi:hypothetical protein
MDPLKVATRGFLMPIYALIDGVLAYTVNQVIIASQTASQASSSGLPGYALFSLSFAIMGFMMTASGYFEDLSGYAKTAGYGLKYPVQAIIYGFGAAVGMALFWNALIGVTVGGIGDDAIFSSIASIVILFITAIYSLRSS